MEKKNNIVIKRIIQRCGCDMVLPLALVYVFYIILHGHISPGGGFQGGVLMTAIIILIYLGHGYEATCRALNVELLRRTEGLAVTLYIAIAMLGVVFGAQCLADRRREREPVLRLSGSNLFLRRNAWVCLPLAMIGEIRLKRRGRRECVVVLVENDAYESRYIEDARAVLGEIERAAEKARQG